ncbi:MAG TPA: class I SAM-dependent methyltransferase [Clostridiales bacterium]|nr:class I SAM-dependent methyltransferase [Clostridiales bacterium]HQP69150.1 class I SAM-dependent methyltransferase [Clostridiales bacterium]
MPKTEPFEKHISEYEKWFEDNAFAYESEIMAIKQIFPKSANGIEIGVGSGRFSLPLGIKKGIDPSAKMTEIAIHRGIEVTNGVAEDLPYKDSQFDFALMVTTVCFLDDIKKAFSEAYRVLKPDGAFVIGFIDKESPIGKLYEKYKEGSVFYRSAVFYTTGELVSYLKEAGFKNFQFTQTIFRDLNDLKAIEEVREGYGEGSFVVIKSIK